MKKYLKIILLITLVLLIIESAPSLAVTYSKVKNIDVNDIDLSSIDSDKIEDVKDVLEDIDFNSLDASSVVENADKEEIKKR